MDDMDTMDGMDGMALIACRPAAAASCLYAARALRTRLSTTRARVDVSAAARRSIDRGERRVIHFFDEVMVRRVEAGWITRIADPAHVFININYLDDLEKF